MKEKEIIEKIVNKQFEMIGIKLKYEDIPADNMIKVTIKKKEKSVAWYEYYKFLSEKQYLEWKKWSIEVLKENDIDIEQMDEIDLLYGMNYDLGEIKKGTLF